MSNANWDGSPVTLEINQSVNMPQAPNGSMALLYSNLSSEGPGQLALISSGVPPQFLNAPPFVNQPSFFINNWQGNNLNVTNVSVQARMYVELCGPGLPGQNPRALEREVPLTLGYMERAVATTTPTDMQLGISSNAAQFASVMIFGGPPDATGSNVMVIAINAPQNTGPGSGIPAPAGYYATTVANQYTLQLSWGGGPIFIANVSQRSAAPITVLLHAK